MDNSLPKPTNPFDLPSSPQKPPFPGSSGTQASAPRFDDKGDDFNPFLDTTTKTSSQNNQSAEPVIEVTPDELPTAPSFSVEQPVPAPKPAPIAAPEPVKAPEPATAPQPTPPAPKPAPANVTPATMTPAYPPKGPASASPIIFAALGGGLLLTTAGTAFFWVQNQTLKHQLTTLQSIEAQRELNATPTPTPTATATPTQGADNTGTTNLAFNRINDVVNAAQQFSSTAQLLMITTTGSMTVNDSAPTSLDTSKVSYNFWFRKAPGTKSYFYVTTDPAGGDPKVVSPANVTPDNNIPDLLDSMKNNALGIDADQAHSMAWSMLLASYSSGNRPSSISAKYLRSIPSNPTISTPVNLWQLTYKFAPSVGIKDVVVQVDANGKKIIYTNIPSNLTTPTPTATGSAATGS